MVCLETDFLISLIRKDGNVLKKLEKLVSIGERITTTPINAAELFKGAFLSEKVEMNLKFVRGLLDEMEILEFDLKASEIYGRIFSKLKKDGEIIGDMDILIASICLSHKERIVTKNVKHYGRIEELNVESW
jgi:predicted nucleic acid-binding protein